jgi:hypothetical protein
MLRQLSSRRQRRRYNLHMRMNTHMRRLLPVGLTDAFHGQPTLVGIAERKLVRLDDCIIFDGERDNRGDFPDRTGYECFVNHIHIDDLVPKCSPQTLVEQAVVLAASLNHRLRIMAPNTTFRFLISAHNDGGCTLRFHTVRSGEEWVADNLENYAEEAIAVIESDDLPSHQNR